MAFLAVWEAGCNSGLKSKERVRADLLAHLQKAGFNTQTLVVEITQLQFAGNVAHLAVSFRPPGSGNVHDAMTMNYTMELRDGHWTVTGRGDSQGHGMGQGMPGAAGDGGAPLPSGHPAVSGQSGAGMMPGQGMGQPMQLPEGHPSLQSMPPATPPAQSTPPGHPKTVNPPPAAGSAPRSSLDQRGRGGNLPLLARELPVRTRTGLAG